MKKLLAVVMASSFIFTACSTEAPKLENGEEVIASVDQGSITVNDLYNALKNRVGHDYVAELIDRLLLEELYPVDEDMQTKIDDQVAQVKEYYGEELDNVLKSNGFKDEDDYRSFLALQMQREAAVLAEIKKDIKDADVEERYEGIVPKIRASHILITPEGSSEEEIEAAKALAEDIINQLDEGADFAELAEEYSADGSSQNGGDLGFFAKDGTMVPEFEEAAFELENINDYSKVPVETQYGFHIILKTDEKEKAPFEDMKEELLDEMATEQLQEEQTLFTTILNDIRKANGFEIFDTDIKSNYDSLLNN